MSTRATRFAGPIAVAGGAGTSLFTVPAGHRALLRNLRVVNFNSATAVSVGFYVGAVANNNLISRVTNVPTGELGEDDGWIVLNAGEELRGFLAAGSNAHRVSIHGYDLLL